MILNGERLGVRGGHLLISSVRVISTYLVILNGERLGVRGGHLLISSVRVIST